MKIVYAPALALAAALALSSPAQADAQQDAALVDAFLELGVLPGPDAPKQSGMVCKAISQGFTVDQLARGVRAVNDVTPEQAKGMVQAYVSIYCPTAQKTPPTGSVGGRVG